MSKFQWKLKRPQSEVVCQGRLWSPVCPEQVRLHGPATLSGRSLEPLPVPAGLLASLLKLLND